MKPLAEYNIPFTGLKIGSHDFEYELNDAFFAEFGEADFRNANVLLEVVLEKRDTMLTFDFSFEGSVETDCDRCGDPMRLLLRGHHRLIVKFGDSAQEQSDEIVVIPHSDYQINIAQYAYEFFIINMPLKRVHDEGECNPEVLARLEDLRVDEPEEPATDPRWDALNKLKNKN